MKLPPLDIELCDDVPVGLLNMKKKTKKTTCFQNIFFPSICRYDEQLLSIMYVIKPQPPTTYVQSCTNPRLYSIVTVYKKCNFL